MGMELDAIKASVQSAYDVAVAAVKGASDAVDSMKGACDSDLSAAYQKGWDDKAAFPSDGTPVSDKLYSQAEADEMKVHEREVVVAEMQPQIDDLNSKVIGLQSQIADLQVKFDAVSAENASMKADAQGTVNAAFASKMTEVMASLDELAASEQADVEHVGAMRSKLNELVPPVVASPVEPAPVPVEPAPVDPQPVEPAPVDPAPVEPAPVEPEPAA